MRTYHRKQITDNIDDAACFLTQVIDSEVEYTPTGALNNLCGWRGTFFDQLINNSEHSSALARELLTFHSLAVARHLAPHLTFALGCHPRTASLWVHSLAKVMNDLFVMVGHRTRSRMRPRSSCSQPNAAIVGFEVVLHMVLASAVGLRPGAVSRSISVLVSV